MSKLDPSLCYKWSEPDSALVSALVRGDKAKRALLRAYMDRPLEVLPGIMSTDREFLTFKDLLSKEATRLIHENVDDDGRAFGTGVTSNFLGLRHISGFGMLPATYPVANNSLLRKEKGLSNGITKPWHRWLLHALVREYFGDLTPAKLPIREGTSTGFDLFANDMPTKVQMAHDALRDAQKAGSLMAKGDFKTAWLSLGLGGGSYAVYRDQPSDKVTYDPQTGLYIPNPRYVASLEYAITSGQRGAIFTADKEIGKVDFTVPKGFFRMRRRTAYAAPAKLNYALGPVASSVRENIYTKFPFTYHHRTREDTEHDLREWAFIIMADVTQHDQFWPAFILDEVTDVLREMGFAEWWIQLYRVKSKLPIYVTGVGPDLPNGLIGDPFAPNIEMGLQSGTVFTDIEGSLLMTWVYLIIQLEHTAPHLIPKTDNPGLTQAFVSSYLRGELPICLKDKSDDGALGWRDPAMIPAARVLMEKMKAGEQVSPYMLVSFEHGGAYLGSILLYPRDGDPKGVTLIGNVVNLLVNQFSPEYGVQSRVKDRSRVKRPFPGLGWESIPQNYGTAPAFGEAMSIVESTWRKVYGFSYAGYREKLLQHDKLALMDFVRAREREMGTLSLTPIDLEVLDNPDKLAYKYMPSDVSPQIFDLLFKGLGLDATAPYLSTVTGVKYV
jgi:hypothetical protein